MLEDVTAYDGVENPRRKRQGTDVKADRATLGFQVRGHIPVAEAHLQHRPEMCFGRDMEHAQTRLGQQTMALEIQKHQTFPIKRKTDGAQRISTPSSDDSGFVHDWNVDPEGLEPTQVSAAEWARMRHAEVSQSMTDVSKARYEAYRRVRLPQTAHAALISVPRLHVCILAVVAVGVMIALTAIRLDSQGVYYDEPH